MDARIDVLHKGKPKMTGKLFEHGGRHFFLHKVTKDSQAHRKLESPGGIDVAVVFKLLELKPAIGDVTIIHSTPSGTWRSTPEDVRRGNRSVQGGRDRYFLPWAMWTEMAPISYDPRCNVTIIAEAPPTVWENIKPPEPKAPPAPKRPRGVLPGQEGFSV